MSLPPELQELRDRARATGTPAALIAWEDELTHWSGRLSEQANAHENAKLDRAELLDLIQDATPYDSEDTSFGRRYPRWHARANAAVIRILRREKA